VDRPRLLPGEVEALGQPQHAGLAVAHAEAPLDHGAQVTQAPRDAAVAREPGASQDQRLEGGLLPVVERAGTAGARPVAQALDACLVVPVDPVAERLAGHAGEPRRLLARQAFQRIGQREQPGADPTVALAAGEPTQFGRAAVGADRQRCRHAASPGKPSGQQRPSHPAGPSSVRQGGITSPRSASS
jgi:hypothetical protein